MSGYRRHLMAKLASRGQYIEGYCNVYNETYSFYIRLVGETTKQVSVTTNNEGYWRYELDKAIYSLEASFTRISQEESDKLVSINFHCDTSGVISTYIMCGRFGTVRFACTNLKRVTGLVVSSNCTNFNAMFQYCSNLEYVSTANWNLSGGVNCNNVFNRCSNLTAIALRGFELASATSANGFFRDCTMLESVGIPAIPNGCSVDNMFDNDTSLVNVVECGNIGAITSALSFARSPLTLQSAINILSALQDLNGGTATLTFATSTQNLISADTTAMNLVAQAQLKGWTITGF